MSARDDIHRLFESGATSYRLDEYLDAHRAERDAEIMRWLGKKAREYRATGSTQHKLQADTIELMASKISRGAVRPDNTRLPAGIEPTFFEPGRTYQHSAWQFRCDAVTTHPESGQRAAFGWFRFSNDAWRDWCADEAQWADGWTEVAEAGKPSRG